MGIHREYARLTPDELKRALEDPAWAQERLDELGEAWVEDDSEPEEVRFFDVDKAWPGIEFVFAQAGLPVEVTNGTEPLPTTDEWDYGPPTYLNPAQVAAVAERVAVLPIIELVNDLNHQLVRAENLYQVGEWSEDDRDYVAYHAQRLQRFYAAAAKAGDAVVVMLT